VLKEIIEGFHAKMPLGKLKFFAYIISQKLITNQQKQLHNNAFHVKKSHSAKN